jgi:hypothetical protein
MDFAVPEFRGDAGVRDLVATMRESSYLKLLGKCLGGGMATGLIVRRLPPQLALPIALMAGIYIGLEMAAWMEEEAAKERDRDVIDASVVDVAPALDTEAVE